MSQLPSHLPEDQKLLLQHAPPEYGLFYSSPREHYSLLQTLCHDMSGLVVDIGTLFGMSALAMSTNPNLEVWSYDITNHIPADAPIRDVPNISFRLKNGIDAIPDFVTKTSFIVLDIDPHDGKQEKDFLQRLEYQGFKGRVLCDDIHLNPAMEAFWFSVTQRKEDLTEQGHWSGTGLIYFD